MFLDVFDLVLPNILSNIGQIFKGKCVLVMCKANWINNYIFLVM